MIWCWATSDTTSSWIENTLGASPVEVEAEVQVTMGTMVGLEVDVSMNDAEIFLG